MAALDRERREELLALLRATPRAAAAPTVLRWRYGDRVLDELVDACAAAEERNWLLPSIDTPRSVDLASSGASRAVLFMTGVRQQARLRQLLSAGWPGDYDYDALARVVSSQAFSFGHAWLPHGSVLLGVTESGPRPRVSRAPRRPSIDLDTTLRSVAHTLALRAIASLRRRGVPELADATLSVARLWHADPDRRTEVSDAVARSWNAASRTGEHLDGNHLVRLWFLAWTAWHPPADPAADGWPASRRAVLEVRSVVRTEARFEVEALSSDSGDLMYAWIPKHALDAHVRFATSDGRTILVAPSRVDVKQWRLGMILPGEHQDWSRSQPGRR
jgi:hypothetical protein